MNLQPQDVYVVIEPYDSGLYEKRSGVIIMDVEDFKKIIMDAFAAGDDFGNYDFIKRNKLEKDFAWLQEIPPAISEYLNQLITP